MNFKEMAYHRRAINFFDPKSEVSDKLIQEMVEIASRTPSSFNLQPWNIMILREQAEKEKLKSLAWNQEKIVEAPVVLIVLADLDGYKEGHPTVERNWQEMVESGSMNPEQRDWFINAAKSMYGKSDEASLAFAVKNTGFFAMSLMYAATSMGLESHPMDGFNHDKVIEAFNIPNNYRIPLLLAIGYKKPDLELHPPKWRKSYEEIVVHFD